MPLSVNVGLSRKASRDYQSTGVSINVTAELDQSLLARPQELQQQIDDLYSQAEAALQRQVQQSGKPASPQHPGERVDRAHERVNSDGNGHSNGNGRHANDQRRPAANGNHATESQRRAISAIARRLNVDAALEAREVIGAELEDLTLRQASELIDHLKQLQSAAGRGGR